MANAVEVRNNYKRRDLCICATSVTRSIWKDLVTGFSRYSATALGFVQSGHLRCEGLPRGPAAGAAPEQAGGRRRGPSRVGKQY